ncbi:MAG: hypothetical protein ABSG84_04910 [Acidobacteriaceae bacterium]|jgi:hypothetical protein
MSDAYTDARREPAKPHQCAHYSQEDGTRCRATAMHNQILCYHHRVDDIPTVIENDPFLLENLDTREAIQKALGQVAARLACNHMDFERAKLLLQTINYAQRNLPPHPRATSQSAAQSSASRYPEASASGLSTPVEEEGTLAPGAYSTQQPSADEDPAPPEREVTPDELVYIQFTAMQGEETSCHPRPASISDEEIRTEVNLCRKSWGRPPIHNLILAPAPEPQPSPDPATLPTLNAAASAVVPAP